MQHTDVVIVGAGPSGLALAVALSHFKVKSVILEKQHEICEDPRAIALAGDALRILSLLGVSEDEMRKIAQPLCEVHFHNGPFNAKPFLTLDHSHDWSDQSLPNASVVLQPGIEKLLRRMAQESDYITLNLDCNVVGIQQTVEAVEAVYELKGESDRDIVRGKYLVGADGKRGFVRKRHLEERGIKQVTGLYKYEATWVAANLRVTMPTPESHPDFSLWKLGYKPEELWDIFWPGGFHFCTHSTMPVATGRFGPVDDKYWRFEYELPPNFQLPENIQEHLEKQMKPHLTIPASRLRRNGRQPDASVLFPWDCVEVVRCAPAHFAQKVVSRWYDGRVILIGDAAHVFPPFGAQGIANGLRDALGLSWRLALLCDSGAVQNPPMYNEDTLLGEWARERRQGVDEGTRLTSSNGLLLQTKSRILPLAVQCASSILSFLPRLCHALLRRHFTDAAGFQGVQGGFFLEQLGGGVKNAQVLTKGADGSFVLSDKVFWASRAALTVVLLKQPTNEELINISQLLKRVDLPARFLAENVVCLDMNPISGSALDEQKAPGLSLLTPATVDELRAAGHTPALPYDHWSIRNRAQASARYVLMRADFIIFSQAPTLEQLEHQLKQAYDMVASS